MILSLFLVVAYLIGSVPFAVLVSRAFGLADPRSFGSGNPGATNVLRSGNKKAALLTLFGDAAKGALAVVLARAFGPQWFDAATLPLVVALAGLTAFVGHVFPVFLGFKGGKGVATMGGACIALQPIIFVVLTLVWVAVRKLSGKASLASLMLTFGFPLGVFLLGGPGWEIATAGALGALVLLRHLDNIKRLASGRELSASRKSQPAE